MHVLIVSHHSLPHVGGLEVEVDHEIRALVNEGHHVTHVTSTISGKGQSPVYGPRVRQIRVPATSYLERKHHLAYPIFSPSLIPVLWRETRKVDVVNAHGFIFMSSVVAIVIASLQGKRRMLTDHGGIQVYHTWIHTSLARIASETLGRLNARLANRLIAYNLRVLEELEHLAGTTSKSLFLPYPVDPVLFHRPTDEERRAARARLGWTDGRKRVLFVGRLIPDKGVLVLLQAADPSYDIAFCGPGDPAILGKLPRSGTEYLPPRPQAELVSLYHAADVLVLPSSREGFPLVVREALACGLKAVLTYERGYEPYRRLPGLFFSDRTPASIRQVILEALKSPIVPDPNSVEDLSPAPQAWIRRMYGLSETGR